MSCIAFQPESQPLFKILQGHDRALVRTATGEVDEIRTYTKARYITANEGAWRLLQLKTNDRSVAVIRLDLHLPDQDNLTFPEDADVEATATADSTSMLLGWFAYNARQVRTWVFMPYSFRWCWRYSLLRVRNLHT